jgi:hypothetical protein
MSPALIAMYALCAVTGMVSYFVSRGPDGQFTAFFIGFAVIAVIYLTLAWVTRHQTIGLHIGIHLVLLAAAIAIGMSPKPHLDEMAGMLYLLAPLASAATIILALLIRLLGRWI